MSSERERELRDEQINELKAFRKIGETFNVLGIEMIVACIAIESHYLSIDAYYVDKDGVLNCYSFAHSKLEFLKLQNKDVT